MKFTRLLLSFIALFITASAWALTVQLSQTCGFPAESFWLSQNTSTHSLDTKFNGSPAQAVTAPNTKDVLLGLGYSFCSSTNDYAAKKKCEDRVDAFRLLNNDNIWTQWTPVQGRDSPLIIKTKCPLD